MAAAGNGSLAMAKAIMAAIGVVINMKAAASPGWQPWRSWLWRR
jgi:hypothetical protein